jgi:hypothetical protein
MAECTTRILLVAMFSVAMYFILGNGDHFFFFQRKKMRKRFYDFLKEKRWERKKKKKFIKTLI